MNRHEFDAMIDSCINYVKNMSSDQIESIRRKHFNNLTDDEFNPPEGLELEFHCEESCSESYYTTFTKTGYTASKAFSPQISTSKEYLPFIILHEQKGQVIENLAPVA